MTQNTNVVTCTECGRVAAASRTARTDSGTRFIVQECECGNESTVPAFAPDVIGAMDGFASLSADGQELLRENITEDNTV